MVTDVERKIIRLHGRGYRLDITYHKITSKDGKADRSIYTVTASNELNMYGSQSEVSLKDALNKLYYNFTA